MSIISCFLIYNFSVSPTQGSDFCEQLELIISSSLFPPQTPFSNSHYCYHFVSEVSFALGKTFCSPEDSIANTIEIMTCSE